MSGDLKDERELIKWKRKVLLQVGQHVHRPCGEKTGVGCVKGEAAQRAGRTCPRPWRLGQSSGLHPE